MPRNVTSSERLKLEDQSQKYVIRMNINYDLEDTFCGNNRWMSLRLGDR